ncbi:PRC-barrel domain-containing protein [Streptomyces sp. NPDC056296]|uniref:PRC-barrel domain-containing protein n=1 Tax=Streptomyces sp. NPDC056296 TaxID=3345775 RepID=UPI0035D7DA32
MTTGNAQILNRLSDSQQAVETPEQDVRDRKVVDADANDIGTVDDLLIDEPERKARFLLVAHGGFLGFGETKSFIPVEAVTHITDDQVFIDQSRERVAQAPAYDPDLTDEPDYYSNVYG